MATKLSLKEILFSQKNAIGSIYPENSDTLTKKLLANILRLSYPIYISLFNFKNLPILIFTKKKINHFDNKPIKINFKDEKKKELQDNGWCFIEDFFDNNTYSNLIKHWPQRYFFNLSKKTIKYYYMTFFSINKKKPRFIEKIPYMKFFYDYLCGSEASKIFSNFLNYKKDCKDIFENKSIICTEAQEKSYLIPHIDGVSKKQLSKKTFNFIYFLDGNNNFPEYSGATGIYMDNEFKKKVFVPNNLKNTCLVYDSSDNFFHGFKSMKKGGFRKAITFQFFNIEVN